MPYATRQDMIDSFRETELVQLTNEQVEESTVIDDTVLTKALQRASDEIDGYLAGRYALPLATVPANLVGICCDIARYRLYDDRATEQVTKRYDDAVKYLKALATGTISLTPSATNEPVPGAGGAQSFGNERVFSADTLKDY